MADEKKPYVNPINNLTAIPTPREVCITLMRQRTPWMLRDKSYDCRSKK